MRHGADARLALAAVLGKPIETFRGGSCGFGPRALMLTSRTSRGRETPPGPLFSADITQSQWFAVPRSPPISIGRRPGDKTGSRGRADYRFASVARALGRDVARGLRGI
jgi:hypothetical protein